jgi:hypothetical protein
VGMVAGWAASVTGPSKTTMELVGFPGEILLSMLRALVVPLIMSSIIVGITSLGAPYSTHSCIVRACACAWHSHMLSRIAHTPSRTHSTIREREQHRALVSASVPLLRLDHDRVGRVWHLLGAAHPARYACAAARPSTCVRVGVDRKTPGRVSRMIDWRVGAWCRYLRRCADGRDGAQCAT